MSNLNVPYTPSSIGTWSALAPVNFGAFALLRSDGSGSTLGLPSHTMMAVNTVTCNVKPPIGKQESYIVAVKLTRNALTGATNANPNPRITVEMIVKAPKGTSQDEIRDAVYDHASLVATQQVHTDLIVRGIPLRNVV